MWRKSPAPWRFACDLEFFSILFSAALFLTLFVVLMLEIPPGLAFATRGDCVSVARASG